MKSCLKYHGGKSFLAKKIVALMPKHIHYVEPYFGGGSVLFEKEYENTSEVINDIDHELTNFWQVLQAKNQFAEFKRVIECVPFSEYEYNDADVSAASLIYAAVGFFIKARQSMSGRMQGFSPITRNRIRRGMNEQVSSWLSAIEGLDIVHNRLKRVVILNRDALEVIKLQDGPNTLFYLDPPYLHETRVSKDVYAYEMNFDQHSKLLSLLDTIKGKFMLSGYRSKLYDEWATLGYARHDFSIANMASSSKVKPKVTESLWCNY